MAKKRLLYTTMRLIWAGKPCSESFNPFKSAVGLGIRSDKPIPLKKVLQLANVDDLLWVLCKAMPVEDRDTAKWVRKCLEAWACGGWDMTGVVGTKVWSPKIEKAYIARYTAFARETLKGVRSNA